MLGEELDHAYLGTKGVDGDRAYALIDDETQKVISTKRPKRWGRMFDLAAVTHNGTVEVRFPDGSSTSIYDPRLVDKLSAFLGRSVSVASTPPPGASFEEVWERELKNDIDPYAGVQSRIDDGDEIVDGGAMAQNGDFFNGCPLHLLTTSSVQHLSQLSPQSRFDTRRFRPNIVIETDDNGFVENDWAGKTMTIGRGVRIIVLVPTPRCVVTTVSQGDLPTDREVLRTISTHNFIDVGVGTFPCVGVYADVASEGEITLHDPVTLD
jgi:uncharacterized protein YcbX